MSEMDYQDNISRLPRITDLSMSELYALGIRPIEVPDPAKKKEAIHNELKPDGRICAAESKVTWDSYDLEIKIRIPMIFSEVRTMEVFQSVLDSVIETMRAEHNNKLFKI